MNGIIHGWEAITAAREHVAPLWWWHHELGWFGDDPFDPDFTEALVAREPGCDHFATIVRQSYLARQEDLAYSMIIEYTTQHLAVDFDKRDGLLFGVEIAEPLGAPLDVYKFELACKRLVKKKRLREAPGYFDPTWSLPLNHEVFQRHLLSLKRPEMLKAIRRGRAAARLLARLEKVAS